ncbi:hypothetical protein ACHQM5_022117 [Ranunculus cassubicifolius]
MDECKDSDSNDDYGSRYTLENGTILLPWYPTQTITSEELGYEVSRKIIMLPWYSSERSHGNQFAHDYAEASISTSMGSSSATTSASPSDNLLSRFVGMGFPVKIVKKVIKDNGQSDEGLILEALLTYLALNDSSPECENASDSDNFLDNEGDIEHQLDKDRKLLHLIDMGFPFDEAFSATDASGPDSSIQELMDFIYAAQTSKSVDAALQEQDQPIANDDEITASYHHGQAPKIIKEIDDSDGLQRWKRKCETWQRQAKVAREKKIARRSEEDITVHIPRHMIGFGVPNDPIPNFHRDIPQAAIGPPFFYYENVACTPKGVWSTMSRFLFEIQPEFVDSLHFCPAARKRGYIHNLPVHNRFPLNPIAPLSIQDTLPLTKKWWPSWDPRTYLNCLNTVVASAKLTKRLRDCLEKCDGNPSPDARKYVLYNCKKWNLVWTGKNKLAPLEPDEMELILGYPKDHTRGVSRTDRCKSLGSSFQVDTVAYHLSVLKKLFPNGINVLSLFSGIGGAEVALHRLGIPLNNVVSVEKSEVNRSILRGWWENTKQKGNLIELDDVEKLGPEQLEHLIKSVGGFDLVIGGSPCNNLTGSNRVSREGLHGEHSVLFYDYFRILDVVKCLMKNN